MIWWNRFGLFTALSLLLLVIAGISSPAYAAGNQHIVFKRQDPLDKEPIDAVVIIESETAPTQSALRKKEESFFLNIRAGTYMVTTQPFSAHQAGRSFKIEIKDDRTTTVRILAGKTYLVGCIPHRTDYLRYLSSRSKEVEGYGLYTYLLLPGPPARGSAREERYIAALEVWNKRSPGFDGDGRKSDRARCNIVYRPVRPTPGSPGSLLNWQGTIGTVRLVCWRNWICLSAMVPCSSFRATLCRQRRRGIRRRRTALPSASW